MIARTRAKARRMARAWAAVAGAAVAAWAAAWPAAAADWAKLADGPSDKPEGSVLTPLGADEPMLYLGGQIGDRGAPVQALDLKALKWADQADLQPPAKRGIHPYYQTAYDPKGRMLYCLTYPGTLCILDLNTRKWLGPLMVPELDGLSWPVAAIDVEGRRLVIVGADKDPRNPAWTRTAILNLDSGTCSRLPLPPKEVVDEHIQLVEAWRAMGELAGRLRMAWYRDPAGRGTDAQRADLARRVAAAGKLPRAAGLAAELKDAAGRIQAGDLLEALKAIRAAEGKADEQAHRQYPVPCSRRNAPLVYDARNKVFVLFGGDHEDYLMNDTWVLDLGKQAWRRMKPPAAPSPRAGHALIYLPQTGRVALYEGYLQSDSMDYGAEAWRVIEPRQLWLYDASADRWQLAGAWGGKADAAAPPAAGTFYGYSAQYYSPPAMAAGPDGRLILAVPATSRRPGGVWALSPPKEAPADADAAGRMEKLAAPPDQRLCRTGPFLAGYCEVADPPKPTNLDALPANQWMRLPDPPRNVARGTRQRDWGTAVWDSRHEQILLWGGGHCVRSSSSVVHYSPISGRMVESYDADEPYGRNGNGGYDSSLLNRPWTDVHSYNTYAYDPPSGLMVSGRGYLYDPARMDWTRLTRMKTPFRYVWSNTVLEATPHGVLAWAQTPDSSDRYGLWLFDANTGWRDLKCPGPPHKPYCDSEGMTYDSKRDRMLMGWGGGYEKRGDGTIWAYGFAAGKMEKLEPAGAELGGIHNTREMVYADHADWVVFAEPYLASGREPGGDPKPDPAEKEYLRIYDCAGNRWCLLDAGAGPPHKVHGEGWCYDVRRKLIFVLTFRGEAYALRLEPAAAKLLTALPAETKP